MSSQHIMQRTDSRASGLAPPSFVASTAMSFAGGSFVSLASGAAAGAAGAGAGALRPLSRGVLSDGGTSNRPLSRGVSAASVWSAGAGADADAGAAAAAAPTGPPVMDDMDEILALYNFEGARRTA